MTARIFAIVPAMVLALGAAAALAQPAAHRFAQFDQASFMDHSTPFPPYDQAIAMVANAAYIGDGSDPCYLQDQQELMDEPGYSIGTGAAQVCNAPTTVGHRSDPSSRLSQKALPRGPGYSAGTAAALVSGA
jgi:hypothetical protein